MHPADQFYLSLEDHQKPLATYISGRIQKWHPTLKQRIKYKTLFFVGNRNICYFNIKNKGIDVGFINGIALQPRPEFITANRKQVVSLFFDYDGEINEHLLKTVVAEAVSLDQKPVVFGRQSTEVAGQ